MIERSEWTGSRTQTSSALAKKVAEQQRALSPPRSIELPVELWWGIIDLVADEIPSYMDGRNELRELARVCRAWYTRCRFHAEERLDIIERDKKEVYRLISRLNEHPERYSRINSVRFVNDKINSFGSFVILMAGKLPQVETLSCGNRHSPGLCEWIPGQLHTQVFLHVRVAFESVTTLRLCFVRFPSAMVFGKLLCALPHLASLVCEGVYFKNPGVIPGTTRSLLQFGTLDLLDSRCIVDFLIETGVGAFLSHVIIRRSGDLEACSTLVRVAALSLSSFHFTIIGRHDLRTFNESGPGLLPDLTPARNLRILFIVLGAFSFDSRELAAALPRASLPNLDEINITAMQVRKTKIKLDKLDDFSYSQIDRILSGPRFPALQKFTLHLQCRVFRCNVKDVLSETIWRTHLSSKLPLLHASGRLL
ncbi:uncharacterized protein FIBRA_05551 [Fibroporia radiculosa]|uniref:F-box domain-containing protein n=1 Tax=Fibroporia radiculosa TaxID=599839 RepID=J4GR85_9APHY|nr:uncharacterized protein FIBRA_05551 [Fibroporia radiculosa]CCM03420.1 predicted protein [Fibroporia radiculosa]